ARFATGNGLQLAAQLLILEATGWLAEFSLGVLAVIMLLGPSQYFSGQGVAAHHQPKFSAERERNLRRAGPVPEQFEVAVMGMKTENSPATNAKDLELSRGPTKPRQI